MIPIVYKRFQKRVDNLAKKTKSLFMENMKKNGYMYSRGNKV